MTSWAQPAVQASSVTGSCSDARHNIAPSSHGLDLERALGPNLERVTVQAGLTIADAARISGVSAYTLRYYEKAGLIRGIRRYAELVRAGDGNET